MLRAVLTTFLRRNSSHRRHAATLSLKAAIAAKIPEAVEELKALRTAHGHKSLGHATVNQVYGGQRGLRCLSYETSILDPASGITFRGHSLPECLDRLPKAAGGAQILPEGLLWLLLTGEFPTSAQVDSLRAELGARSRVPERVLSALDALPTTLHPMSQLSIAVLALQEESVMASEYGRGTQKAQYWEHYLEDAITLIARLPEVAARIYRRTFKGGDFIQSDESLDWSANYCRMLGFDDPAFDDLMRLYLVLHADHEGGNVSANVTRLVGSALSDPYLAYSAGINGLAGPLHGLANQEVLKWLVELKENLGARPASKENLTEQCWATLNSGKVIPGFGHAVLRQTDPRYICQRDFALKHLPEDEMFQLVSALYEVVPSVLGEKGTVKNPWPNCDALSGVLLRAYGLTESNYYTVVFAVSRAIGPLANMVWDRALGLPITTPRSVSTKWIKEHFEVK